MVFAGKARRNEKIFINYRRDDAGGFAGRLSDTLAGYFGQDRVFRDVTGIDYGHDFEQVIDEKLAESGALVVVIGERWTSVADGEGRRRLDDPDDYVCREIQAALRSGVPVIPVLIADAAMPRPEDLPESLRELARRNAMTVTDERWDFDVARLAKILSIDVPGSVAQRRLDLLRAVALLLLLVTGALATAAFCLAVREWTGAAGGLRAAGFSPLVSALPFMAIVIVGTLTVNALPWMEARGRKYGQLAVALAAASTIGSFVNYSLTNVEHPDGALLVNFGVGTITLYGMFALLALAGFRAK